MVTHEETDRLGVCRAEPGRKVRLEVSREPGPARLRGARRYDAMSRT